MYVKADTTAITGSGIIQYSLDGGTTQTYKTLKSFTNSDIGNWVLVEGTYTHTDATVNAVLVLRPSNFVGANCYIDDVMFKEIMPETFEPVSFTDYMEITPYVLTGVSPDMTDSEFLAKVDNSGGQTLTLYDGNGVALDPGAVVGTGNILEVDHDGYKVEYKLIIYGDVDGDGSIGIGDLAAVKLQLLKLDALTGAFKKAADVNKNSSISISDLLAIKRDILNISIIQQ
jgi:hypothetical protein